MLCISFFFRIFAKNLHKTSKIMKRLSFFIGLLAVLVSCKTPAPALVSYEVIPITGKLDTTSSTGMLYALPRQSVEVEIWIRKQEFIRGPYAEFAERLLGVRNIISKNQTVYSIENVMVSQKSEVDPKQIYYVQFNGSELALEYDNGMIISGVNLSKKPSFELGQQDFQKQTPQTQQIVNRPLIPMFNMIEQNDTVFFNQLDDAQPVQRYEIRTTQTVKTPFQKAEEIVANINKIREDRTKLLTGFQEVNYEAAAIRYMNEEFNRMEDEYISMFTGTTKISYETARFEFLPTHKDSLTVELAEFSASYGLLNPATEGASDAQKIILNIALQDDLSSEFQRFSRNIRMYRKGFYYSIPSQGLVTVKLDNQLLYSKPMPFSQFGMTPALPPNPLQIDFSPQTGEIRSVRTID